MKKILVIVSLGLSSCASYKMEVTVNSTGTFYHVYRRHKLHWDDSNSIFYSEKSALDRIEDWRQQELTSRPTVTKKYKN